MYRLSDDEVGFILDDIRRNGVELEELQLSLLDHICCMLEAELSGPEQFRETYRKILPQFFKKELREIQDETYLLLTFKHYYTMKKVMIYSGSISAIFFLTGSLFKIFHWPGASAMFLVGIVLLSFLFLPLLFMLRAKEAVNIKEKINLATGTLFGMTISMATLFKVMHWPYANKLWLISLGILFFLFLPFFFLSGIRNAEKKTNTLVSSILILVGGGCLFMLTSLKPSQRINYAYAQAKEQMENSNLMLKEKIQSQTLPTEKQEIRQRAEAVCDEAEKLKADFLKHIDINPEKNRSKEAILADAGDKLFTTNTFFFTEDGKPLDKLNKLTEAIRDFKSTIIKNNPSANLGILSLEDEREMGRQDGRILSWEESKFYNVPADIVFIQLNQIQLDARILSYN